MNGSSDQISIIVFAILAVFVIWKLRSVLGARPTDDPSKGPTSDGSVARPPVEQQTNVLRFPGAVGGQAAVQGAGEERWKGFATPGSHLWAGLDSIAATDSSFDPANFSKGATKAYELIVSAYAAGDVASLQNLLAPDVYESFEKDILTFKSLGQTKQLVIVSVEPEELLDANVSNGFAQIAVRFSSKLISATRDQNGVVVQGDPEKVEEHSDEWTFGRLLKSPDPNWKLIATRSAA